MNLKEFIIDVPDFPKENIIFKDISSLLANGQAFNYAIWTMAKEIINCDVIAAPESRGFIFGAAIAAMLSKPFVMIRKSKKMPEPTLKQEYILEYGKNQLELSQKIDIQNKTVAIIDDVLATGGTIEAIIKLIHQANAKATKIVTLIELLNLEARKKLQKYNVEIQTLITY
ncbi:adenine phosphoribosyltransferase [Mycoplasma sp. 1018B]|uniref:adenine phosphoribosyltransferase n=1 Tax=Mycoplasma sp. 1018B TaxID=2967302 RepID=UPI00211BDA52|nr:adenine phosphoribosyltransferase [Mycoplasma sp. 1018B]UUM19233.1 adenine phosphoribosyltransferase [Mycoplasma sp. 1018B]